MCLKGVEHLITEKVEDSVELEGLRYLVYGMTGVEV